MIADIPYHTFFYVLSSEIRLEIVRALKDIPEMNAGEIHALFPRVSPAAVSQHLGVMMRAGLLSLRPDAQRRYYSLNPEGLEEAGKFLIHLAHKTQITQSSIPLGSVA